FTKERPEDLLWLKRRFAMLSDFLRESPAYQDILEEGIEEGLEQGLEQGLKQGRLLAKRETFLTLIEVRFPRLKTLAMRQASLIDKPEILEDLMVKLLTVQSMDEMRHHLLTWRKSDL